LQTTKDSLAVGNGWLGPLAATSLKRPDEPPLDMELEMTASLLRVSAALVLLAACSSADESALQGSDAAGDGAVRNAGLGISSSELAGQPVPGTQEDLEVSVGDRVYFTYDSVVLNPQAIQTLDGQAAWLEQYPNVLVTVEGHADERGTREYNLALGDRRANAVRNYLVALDIPTSRILTISYGEERPADPGHDEQAWTENRRAVTTVTTTQ
jgi:peptidoglycan-associated lipoprotein